MFALAMEENETWVKITGIHPGTVECRRNRHERCGLVRHVYFGCSADWRKSKSIKANNTLS
jgi:hypothetical protein